jgi:hypothetical protein
MSAPKSERDQIDRELTARACEHALWISLLLAQRAGWTDIVNSTTLAHATAIERRRALEASA